MSENEIWKDTPGFPGYQVSNIGNVKSCRIKGKMAGIPRNAQNPTYRLSDKWRMKNKRKIAGYQSVTLFHNHKSYTKKVYRLILEAFVGPCPEGCVGCHNNGIKTDDQVGNLRWDTVRANFDDCIKHGSNRGENNGRSVVTANDVREIRELREQGVLRTVLSKRYGVTPTQITTIAKRKQWQHVK